VRLQMAMAQCEAGIVGREIELGFLEPAKHHDVLDEAGGRLSAIEVNSKLCRCRCSG
jgi:hypothetical protein